MTTTMLGDSKSIVTDSVARDLHTQLAILLPGLSDVALDSLTLRACEELKERVGYELWTILDDESRDEFTRLADTDELGSDWLDRKAPSFRSVVVAHRARLVADIVDTVIAADPGAIVGVRDIDELVTADLDMVEEHFICRDLNYERGEDVVTVGFGEGGHRPAVVVTIRFANDGQLLVFTAGAPDALVNAEGVGALAEFVNDWNVRRWLPKALVSAPDDSGTNMLVGEVAVPMIASTTRLTVDHLVTEAISRLLGLMKAARTTLVL